MTAPGREFITIHRETFSAAEAEAITGVPQVMMRDWRRRNFLKTKLVGRRAVFQAYDLGHLIALHELTSQGVAVGVAVLAAGVAASIIEFAAEIATCSPADRPFVGLHGSHPRRFVIVPRDGDVVRAGNVDDWVAMRDKEGKAASAIVIDCKALGDQIARLAPRPVVVVERRSAE
jgi:hypothetical protein